mmetsp:Transcript_34243/g.65222  ORF Transcript_34243/g.65222 Transcript_34243/m.65222 type:complete len:187 (+) Transcript_34243:1637-2197(+)
MYLLTFIFVYMTSRIMYLDFNMDRDDDDDTPVAAHIPWTNDGWGSVANHEPTNPKWDSDEWNGSTPKPTDQRWTDDGHGDSWDGSPPVPEPPPPSQSSSTSGKAGKSGSRNSSKSGKSGGLGSGGSSSGSSNDGGGGSRGQITKANSNLKFSESNVNGSVEESVLMKGMAVHLAAAAVVGGAVLLL